MPELWSCRLELYGFLVKRYQTAITVRERADHLSDAAEESLMNTSENSCSNEKEDTFNFSNDDFETEEPELIEIFKNSFEMNDGFSVSFYEKYHIFAISIDETRDAAVIYDSEIMEISEESTPIKFLENALEKVHYMMLNSSILIHLLLFHLLLLHLLLFHLLLLLLLMLHPFSATSIPSAASSSHAATTPAADSPAADSPLRSPWVIHLLLFSARFNSYCFYCHCFTCC
ncbi:hypothetical protein TNIN_350721 [Trichonephila inaurata madagascariensis]|uniref:Uncharacterized protein n=1 Tax=Trichonephila inaurata madagascariensis TaxID=2747483 RepID=A0A8X6XLK4_9ARAC|nr:hypothetical protein TNIN_350721 [Trichonephila inaurata madagascariensis]